MAPLIEAVNLTRALGDSGVETRVLDGVCLKIEPGEFASIIGPSGSGKSTLLYLLGLLDRPTSGEVRFEGRAIHELDDLELARLRNQRMGFIYQFHFLLPEFSAAENVMIPMLAQGLVTRAQATDRARELLALLGLNGKEGKRPNQLSGGEQQRVAIARALANRPAVIFGDEPTGNLDTKNSRLIFDILERLNREQGQTVVVVTHDPELAQRAPRIIRVRDGKVEGEECRR